VLRISQTLVDGMVAHARADHPDEACGVIPVRLIPMINADRSPTFFRFDPSEQLQVAKQMWADDEEIVVVYHSHTATEAYPSRTDVSYAAEPQAHYVLVSTAESGPGPGPVSVRSFRILDGTVTEEEIELLADLANVIDPE
jgi:proteasome lid subunit RPN8/RPN11